MLHLSAPRVPHVHSRWCQHYSTGLLLRSKDLTHLKVLEELLAHPPRPKECRGISV